MISEALLAACISNIARTRALGLLSLSGLPESIRNNFETLGSLRYYEEGKTLLMSFPFTGCCMKTPALRSGPQAISLII
jgi:hypothetical protein